MSHWNEENEGRDELFFDDLSDTPNNTSDVKMNLAAEQHSWIKNNINTFVSVNAIAFIVIEMRNDTNALTFKFINHIIMHSTQYSVNYWN